MKMKRIFGAAICAAMILSSTSCLRAIANKYAGKNASLDGYSVSSEEDISSAQEADEPVSAATEYGNETVGWFSLDDTFFKWYTPGNSETCLQFAQSPTEILTMDVLDCATIKEQAGIEEFNANLAANSRMYMLEEASKTENIQNLTGSREPLGSYEAYQIYCYYPDEDQYLVTWFMDSPDKIKVYYVAAEFRSTEMDFFHFAQTYRMPGD